MDQGRTIEEIKQAGNKIIEGSWPDATEMKTLYGKRTLNFWRKLPDGTWDNYNMRTMELLEDLEKNIKKENNRNLKGYTGKYESSPGEY